MEGFNVLSAIAAVPVDANDKPLTPVTITSAQLVPDVADGVVTFTAAAGFTGTATITVTASEGENPSRWVTPSGFSSASQSETLCSFWVPLGSTSVRRCAPPPKS